MAPNQQMVRTSMKIFFLTSSSNKSGGSRQALYLAQGLEQRGHQLCFFVPHDAKLPELAPEFNWRWLPEKRSAWKQAVAACLPQNQPCVLHAFHNKAVKKAAWWGLAWRRRGMLVAAQRGVIYRPNNPLPYWSPGIDCFMVNSSACARVLRSVGLSPARLHLVYNGIPAERITPGRAPEDVRRELGLEHNPLFCCVANDSANKGAKKLLQAFAAAGPDNGSLLLIGVTPEKFAPLCTELGIKERVRLLPPVDHVADYLQLAEIFVLPSFSESMPNTLQEALCMGLGVVANDVGGVADCVSNNGLLVKPGARHALTEALQTAASSAALRTNWKKRSLELAADFTMERKIQQVETIYLERIRQRGLV